MIGVFIATVVTIALIMKKMLPVWAEQRVSSLFEGMAISRAGAWQVLYYPAFMVRRFMIIWAPAFLFTDQSSKILAITFINQAYIVYYFAASPHSGR